MKCGPIFVFAQDVVGPVYSDQKSADCVYFQAFTTSSERATVRVGVMLPAPVPFESLHYCRSDTNGLCHPPTSTVSGRCCRDRQFPSSVYPPGVSTFLKSQRG